MYAIDVKKRFFYIFFYYFIKKRVFNVVLIFANYVLEILGERWFYC